MATRALATAFVNIVPGTVELEKYLKSKLGKDAQGAGVDAGKKMAAGIAQGLESASAKMKSAGQKMTLAITTPLLGVATAGVKTAADFGVTMASMQVNSGATAEQMEELRALAMRLGADTVFSAGEAAQAMLELSKGGMDVATISGGALEAAMNLAATESMDLADASVIVTQSLNTFGLEAGELSNAVDILAAGAVASTAGVYDIAAAMKYVGNTSANLGVPIADVVTGLAALNNAGIDASTAGTSLNRMLLGLVPTTGKARDAMEDLDLNFINADGSIMSMTQVIEQLNDKIGVLTESEQIEALKAIFGVQGMRAGLVLMGLGQEGFADLNTEVNRVGIASDLANARMSGLAGAMEQARGATETAMIAIGEALAPVVIELSEHVIKLMDSFVELDDEQKKQVLMYAGIAAAIGPLLFITGSLIQSIMAIGTAMKGLFALIVAHPIGALVTAIAALVAGLVYFFTQTELGKQIWSDFVEWFTTTMGAIGDWFANLWTEYIQPPLKKIAQAFQNFYNDVIIPVFTGIMVYIGLWAALFEWVWENIFGPLIDTIGKGFAQLWNEELKPFFEALAETWKEVARVMRQFYDEIIQPVFDAFGEGFQWLYENIIKPVAAAITEVFENMVDRVTTVFTALGEIIEAVFKGIVNKIRNPLNNIVDMVNHVINAINGIRVTIPTWVPVVGGRSFSPNLPRMAKIPAMAEGGYVDQPTFAMIGEAGPEVVTPLKDFERMVGIGDGGSKVINYYAAPNQSLNNEQALFQAMRRAKVVANW